MLSPIAVQQLPLFVRHRLCLQQTTSAGVLSKQSTQLLNDSTITLSTWPTQAPANMSNIARQTQHLKCSPELAAPQGKLSSCSETRLMPPMTSESIRCALKDFILCEMGLPPNLTSKQSRQVDWVGLGWTDWLGSGRAGRGGAREISPLSFDWPASF